MVIIRYQANISYTVTFNANGGNTPSPTTKTVTNGGTYGDLATCSRTGYTLAGWFTTAGGGTEVKSTTTVNLSADQTLYAHWKEKVDPGDMPAEWGYVTRYEKDGKNYVAYVYTNNSASMTFTVPKGVTSLDYLVVGGGGGGGGTFGGGGGAGGFLEGTISSGLVVGQSFAVTVGIGGAGVVDNATVGTVSGSSAFGEVVAAGGGCGGNYYMNGVDGASGGGGGVKFVTAGSPTQGYVGGAGYSKISAGGGGGAGGAGTAGTATKSGDGGPGKTSDITGIACPYAGGGGGCGDETNGGAKHGSGSFGGGDGGAGTDDSGCDATTPGSGGGGAGRISPYGASGHGGRGADGIVVVRYEEAAKEYTVIFDANGGNAPSVASKTVTQGQTYGTLATCSRTGYRFDGWYTEASGGTKVETTTTVNLTADQVLYAQWTAVTYSVVYDPDDGSGGGVNPAGYRISAEDQTVALTPPTKAGYTFAGWTVSSEPTSGSPTISGNTLTIPAGTYGSFTVKAVWAQNIAFTAADYTGQYDGNAHGITLTVTTPASGATIRYRTSESGAYDLTTAPTRKEVGTTIVYYQITAPNFTTTTGLKMITINPAALSSLTLDPSKFDYDGNVKTPTLTVKAGSGALTVPASAGYTVKPGSTTSASAIGNYTIAVTGTGNFTGDASADWTIEKKVCEHDFSPMPYVAPTCTTDGRKDDGWKCSTCGEVLQPPTVIPALGHDWGDWIVTVEPTLTTEGARERTCGRCHERETESLPTLGWTFYPEAIAGTRDGIISNSVGQVLNVFFDPAGSTDLVVGVKYPAYATYQETYNVAVPADRVADIGRLDLTGGVKDGADAGKRYDIKAIGTFAFHAAGTPDDGHGDAAFSRQKLDSVILPDELEEIRKYAFAVETSRNGNRLKSFQYGGSHLRELQDFAFQTQQAMEGELQAFFTPNLEMVGTKAFQNCFKVSGTLNTRELTTIPASAFIHCRSLGNVDLPKVAQVGAGAFGTAFFNPVTFTFKKEGSVTLDGTGTGTFGWYYQNTPLVIRLQFPGAAPTLGTSPIVAFNMKEKWKPSGVLTTRCYMICDKDKTEANGWNSLITPLASLSDSAADLTVKDVTADEVAADLGLEASEVQVLGVNLQPAGTAGYKYPILVVGVDASYFDEAHDYTWGNGNGGLWAVEGNWIPNDKGVPDNAKKTATFNTDFGRPFTVRATQDYQIGRMTIANSSPVTLDFNGFALKGPNGDSAVGFPLSATQSDVTFANGVFAFTNSWFTGKGPKVGEDATLTVTEGATVTFTGDGNQSARTSKNSVAPLDFKEPLVGPSAITYEDTYPNVAVTDGGSLTVASPTGMTLANFMLDSVWGHGLVDGGTFAYSNNGSKANTMTFNDGLVVANGGSVTGASKLVLKGGETDIAAGSTVDFTSLSVEGPAKGVIAAAGGTLGVSLTSAATGADLTFAGITLGDVTGLASQTRLTFANGAAGSGALSYSGKSNCTNVFAGGAFTVPSGKTFALGTTPTLKFVLPEAGFASAPLTVQGSGALGNDTLIVIDASQYSGAVVAGGIPLVKMATAIVNLDSLKANCSGVPDGMELALKEGDSKTLVLKLIGHTVTFVANGGTPAEQRLNVGRGQPYGTFPEVSRQGWKFLGWYTAAEGGTRKFTSDTVTSDHTLWAHWEQASYEITYDYADGVKGEHNPASADFGTAFYVSAPTKDGFAFAGWTVTSGLAPSTAVWGTTGSPATKIADNSTRCANGPSGDVYFKDLTSGTSVTLTANYAKLLAADMVKDCYWTGSAVVPPCVDGGRLLVAGSDYTYVIAGATSAVTAGTYQVTLTGKGGYSGTVTRAWTVRQVSYTWKSGVPSGNWKSGNWTCDVDDPYFTDAKYLSEISAWPDSMYGHNATIREGVTVDLGNAQCRAIRATLEKGARLQNGLLGAGVTFTSAPEPEVNSYQLSNVTLNYVRDPSQLDAWPWIGGETNVDVGFVGNNAVAGDAYLQYMKDGGGQVYRFRDGTNEVAALRFQSSPSPRELVVSNAFLKVDALKPEGDGPVKVLLAKGADNAPNADRPMLDVVGAMQLNGGSTVAFAIAGVPWTTAPMAVGSVALAGELTVSASCAGAQLEPGTYPLVASGEPIGDATWATVATACYDVPAELHASIERTSDSRGVVLVISRDPVPIDDGKATATNSYWTGAVIDPPLTVNGRSLTPTTDYTWTIGGAATNTLVGKYTQLVFKGTGSYSGTWNLGTKEWQIVRPVYYWDGDGSADRGDWCEANWYCTGLTSARDSTKAYGRYTDDYMQEYGWHWPQREEHQAVVDKAGSVIDLGGATAAAGRPTCYNLVLRADATVANGTLHVARGVSFQGGGSAPRHYVFSNASFAADLQSCGDGLCPITFDYNPNKPTAHDNVAVDFVGTCNLTYDPTVEKNIYLQFRGGSRGSTFRFLDGETFVQGAITVYKAPSDDEYDPVVNTLVFSNALVSVGSSCGPSSSYAGKHSFAYAFTLGERNKSLEIDSQAAPMLKVGEVGGTLNLITGSTLTVDAGRKPAGTYPLVRYKNLASGATMMTLDAFIATATTITGLAPRSAATVVAHVEGGKTNGLDLVIESADYQILHVIGPDKLEAASGSPDYAPPFFETVSNAVDYAANCDTYDNYLVYFHEGVHAGVEWAHSANAKDVWGENMILTNKSFRFVACQGQGATLQGSKHHACTHSECCRHWNDAPVKGDMTSYHCVVSNYFFALDGLDCNYSFEGLKLVGRTAIAACNDGTWASGSSGAGGGDCNIGDLTVTNCAIAVANTGFMLGSSGASSDRCGAQWVANVFLVIRQSNGKLVRSLTVIGNTVVQPSGRFASGRWRIGRVQFSDNVMGTPTAPLENAALVSEGLFSDSDWRFERNRIFSSLSRQLVLFCNLQPAANAVVRIADNEVTSGTADLWTMVSGNWSVADLNPNSSPSLTAQHNTVITSHNHVNGFCFNRVNSSNPAAFDNFADYIQDGHDGGYHGNLQVVPVGGVVFADPYDHKSYDPAEGVEHRTDPGGTPFDLAADGFYCTNCESFVDTESAKAKQRYPWNNRVDCDYTIGGRGIGQNVSAVLGVKAGGATDFFARPYGPHATAGRHRVTGALATPYYESDVTFLLAFLQSNGQSYLPVDYMELPGKGFLDTRLKDGQDGVRVIKPNDTAFLYNTIFPLQYSGNAWALPVGGDANITRQRMNNASAWHENPSIGTGKFKDMTADAFTPVENAPTQIFSGDGEGGVDWTGGKDGLVRLVHTDRNGQTLVAYFLFPDPVPTTTRYAQKVGQGGEISVLASAAGEGYVDIVHIFDSGLSGQTFLGPVPLDLTGDKPSVTCRYLIVGGGHGGTASDGGDAGTVLGDTTAQPQCFDLIGRPNERAQATVVVGAGNTGAGGDSSLIFSRGSTFAKCAGGGETATGMGGNGQKSAIENDSEKTYAVGGGTSAHGEPGSGGMKGPSGAAGQPGVVIVRYTLKLTEVEPVTILREVEFGNTNCYPAVADAFAGLNAVDCEGVPYVSDLAYSYRGNREDEKPDFTARDYVLTDTTSWITVGDYSYSARLSDPYSLRWKGDSAYRNPATASGKVLTVKKAKNWWSVEPGVTVDGAKMTLSRLVELAAQSDCAWDSEQTVVADTGAARECAKMTDDTTGVGIERREKPNYQKNGEPKFSFTVDWDEALHKDPGDPKSLTEPGLKTLYFSVDDTWNYYGIETNVQVRVEYGGEPIALPGASWEYANTNYYDGSSFGGDPVIFNLLDAQPWVTVNVYRVECALRYADYGEMWEDRSKTNVIGKFEVCKATNRWSRLPTINGGSHLLTAGGPVEIDPGAARDGARPTYAIAELTPNAAIPFYQQAGEPACNYTPQEIAALAPGGWYTAVFTVADTWNYYGLTNYYTFGVQSGETDWSWKTNRWEYEQRVVAVGVVSAPEKGAYDTYWGQVTKAVQYRLLLDPASVPDRLTDASRTLAFAVTNEANNFSIDYDDPVKRPYGTWPWENALGRGAWLCRPKADAPVTGEPPSVRELLAGDCLFTRIAKGEVRDLREFARPSGAACEEALTLRVPATFHGHAIDPTGEDFWLLVGAGVSTATGDGETPAEYPVDVYPSDNWLVKKVTAVPSTLVAKIEIDGVLCEDGETCRVVFPAGVTAVDLAIRAADAPADASVKWENAGEVAADDGIVDGTKVATTQRLAMDDPTNRTVEVRLTLTKGTGTGRLTDTARVYLELVPEMPGDPTDPKDPIPVPKSDDPNEMAGPLGTGDARLLEPGSVATYTIYFENKPEAAAAAQSVTIENALSPWFDWSTFTADAVGFGANGLDAGLVGRRSGQSEVRVAGTNYAVRTTLAFDSETGVATWKLRIAMDAPAGDADGWPQGDWSHVGFLPPNDANHCGEGYVRYSVKIRDDAPRGTVISNAATIVFDSNAPIMTDPAWWNTVDGRVKLLSDALTDATLEKVRKAIAAELSAHPELETLRIGGDERVVRLTLDLGISPKLTFAGTSGEAAYVEPSVKMLSYQANDPKSPECGCLRVRVEPGDGNAITTVPVEGALSVYGRKSIASGEEEVYLDWTISDFSDYLKHGTKGEAVLKPWTREYRFFRVRLGCGALETTRPAKQRDGGS